MNTNIDIPVDEILSPDFDASSLTKQQLRSLLSEVGSLSYEQLPAANAKKQVYLDYFQKHIYGQRTKIANRLAKMKTSPVRDIIEVDRDGSQRLISPFHLQGAKDKASKKVDFDLESGHFSPDNPFQSPEKEEPARGRRRPPTPAAARTRARTSSGSTSRTRSSLKSKYSNESSDDEMGSEPEGEALVLRKPRRQTKASAGSLSMDETTTRRSASVSPIVQKTRSRSRSRSGSGSSPSPSRSPGSRSRSKSKTTARPGASAAVGSVGERLAAEPLTPISRLRAPVYSTAPSESLSMKRGMMTMTARRTFMSFDASWRHRCLQILVILVVFALFLFHLDFYSRTPVCLSKGESRRQLDSWLLTVSAPYRLSHSFCWPCPQYGDCYPASAADGAASQSVVVKCHPGFKYSSHLFGYPVCQLDPRQMSTIGALAMAIHDHLAIRLGSALCAFPHLYEESSDWGSEPVLRQHALLNDVELRSLFRTTLQGAWNEDKMASLSPSQSQSQPQPQSFDFYFDSAVHKLMNSSLSRDFPLKVERHYPVHAKARDSDDQVHEEKYRFMALVPSFSLFCAVKVHGRRGLQRYAVPLFFSSLALTVSLFLLSRSRARKRRQSAAAQLKAAVLQKLVEQEYLNRTDPVHFPSTVPALQLRDALLPLVDAWDGALSLADKKIVWRLVSGSITSDSSVRESVAEWKGEQVRVWEWIGSAVLSPHASQKGATKGAQ